MNNKESDVSKVRISIPLWWINSWLRFTGLRVFVTKPDNPEDATRIGILWWGSPFNMGEKHNAESS